MISEQEKTGLNPKNGQEVAKRKSRLATFTTFPKGDVRYWQEKVFFPHYTRAGVNLTTGEYAARIQHSGRREMFPLDTANKAAAAAKAKEIYLYLQANGWEHALAEYKPKATVSRPARRTWSSRPRPKARRRQGTGERPSPIQKLAKLQGLKARNKSIGKELVLLPPGFVARSLQTAAGMRLARVLPEGKNPARLNLILKAH